MPHEDPPGCFQTGPAIVVSVFRANGTTGVVGSISECETIIYQARLQKAADVSTICAFSGGIFTLTTPDGVVHTISNDVPCIGGDGLGEGCDATRDFIDSVLIPYTVTSSDVVAGFVTATANYTGGVAHDTSGNTPGVGANTPKSTPVVFCSDNDNCTIDVCEPAGQGSSACSSRPTVCAELQSRCAASKNRCMSVKAGALLKCEQKAETPGKVIEPDRTLCRQKANTKFDGGITPANGCFEKLEGKVPNDCFTSDDTTTAGQLVDNCVDEIVQAIDPGTIDQSKCGVGKKKCAAKTLKSLLTCYEKQQKPGEPVDVALLGACRAKAMAKFDGGAVPANGCFAKLEAKTGNDCQPPMNSSVAVKAIVDSCADGFLAFIEMLPSVP
jgi:hypothetical protein